MDPKYDRKKLFLKGYNYNVRPENEEESTDEKEVTDKEKCIDLSHKWSLEGDEGEVKGGNGLKILTPNKLLTRLPILLAHTKARKKSCKLKNEIRQILYLSYQQNKFINKAY